MLVKQGEVFFADLSPVIGSEQGGVRPVVIVQNDIANRFSPTVIVSAVTAQISEEKLPTHVKLPKAEYPLQKDSIILLEQIRTIDKARLTEKICTLKENDLNRVREAWIVSGGAIENVAQETISEVESFYQFIKETVFEKYEDVEYEFKNSDNPVRMIKDSIARYVCSFLNSSGGRVIYGINNDDRVIKGIRLSSIDIDNIKLAIYDKVRGVNPGISPDQLEINFHDLYNESKEIVNGEYILEIIVPASRDTKTIHYIDNGRGLVVRVDGSSRLLQGSEIVSFVLNKYSIK